MRRGWARSSNDVQRIEGDQKHRREIGTSTKAACTNFPVGGAPSRRCRPKDCQRLEASCEQRQSLQASGFSCPTQPRPSSRSCSSTNCWLRSEEHTSELQSRENLV